MVRERLGPHRIDFESWRLDSAFSLSGRRLLQRILRDAQHHETCEKGRTHINIAKIPLSLHASHDLPRFWNATTFTMRFGTAPVYMRLVTVDSQFLLVSGRPILLRL